MIKFDNVAKFCCDDISLIENYDKAINDQNQTWDCHHKLGTELGLSRTELKNRNMYFNVPASQLIFLTHSEHMQMHSNADRFERSKNQKEVMSNLELRTKISIKMKEKMKGKTNTLNHVWMTNGINRVFVKPEQVDYYLSLGYHLGRK